jgi:hypothetical protein
MMWDAWRDTCYVSLALAIYIKANEADEGDDE